MYLCRDYTNNYIYVYLRGRTATHFKGQYPQYLQVICEEGFSISGPPDLICHPNGTYGAPLPRCVPKPPFDPLELDCGQRDPEVVARLYGGADAIPGEFPWNVLITFPGSKFCGGSIINNQWILTAGHCILASIHQACDNRVKGNYCRLINPAKIRMVVTAGAHNRSEEELGRRQVRLAAEVFVHPYFYYKSSIIGHDVGLIKLNESLVYNMWVNRVCLPSSGTHGLVGNAELYVTGWGKTNHSDRAAILQRITVPYITRENCNSEVSYEGTVTESMFCAGYPAGKIDACKGDSGGPLFYLGSNGSYVQGGIVSWGKECAKPNFYGVYSNIAYVYHWIIGYVKTN